MYWLHALTPVHVGSGFGLGFIDLPVMREKVTNWPVVPGSAVKGVLADDHGATGDKREKDPKLRAAFGSGGDENANAGALVFSDARLVCLPVRSLYGTFAWATSKLALQRLKRDLDAAKAGTALPEPPEAPKDHALVAQGSAIASGNRAYLGDLDFTTDATNADAQKWAVALSQALFAQDPAWRTEFQARFIILPNDSFDYFCETGTEVAAHIKIDPSLKTVDKKQGGLWYEEALPAETILAGLVWCDRVFANGVTREDVLVYARAKAVSGEIQIGGKATVGKGRVRFVTAAAGGEAGR
jgi:CRISPR-associated protein Cmr4